MTTTTTTFDSLPNDILKYQIATFLEDHDKKAFKITNSRNCNLIKSPFKLTQFLFMGDETKKPSNMPKQCKKWFCDYIRDQLEMFREFDDITENDIKQTIFDQFNRPIPINGWELNKYNSKSCHCHRCSVFSDRVLLVQLQEYRNDICKLTFARVKNENDHLRTSDTFVRYDVSLDYIFSL